MPSDLSDFVIYGGLYRHVHLDYVPAISLERMHVESSVGPDQPATAKVVARLYNPGSLTDEADVTVEVRDPSGAVVFSAAKKLAPWAGMAPIAEFKVDAPKLWSPERSRSVPLHRDAENQARRAPRRGAIRPALVRVRQARPFQAQRRAVAASRHALPRGSRGRRRRGARRGGAARRSA